MVKWTKYCYKRLWLWTFGAGRELDVVVANINGRLTALPNVWPWLEFELLGEGGSGPQTMSAKTLLDSNQTIDSIESTFVFMYVSLCCLQRLWCINTARGERLRMRVIRDCQAYVVILKMAILRIFYPRYVHLLGNLRANIRDRKTKKVNIVAEM